MVTTYGDLAKAIGRPRAARAVGQALNKNPDPRRVPCFLVVRLDGALGGYSRGVKMKIRKLTRWGVPVQQERVQDVERRRWRIP
jgi:O-6-methylguanine DNA methyltransferase